MTDHPITPPPELVQQWIKSWSTARGKQPGFDDFLATQAANWAADKELDACCEWFEGWVGNDSYSAPLRAARRPKPPSKKERALKALSQMEDQSNAELAAEIRCALEELPDD